MTQSIRPILVAIIVTSQIWLVLAKATKIGVVPRSMSNGSPRDWTVSPVNTAIHAGESTTFTCISDNSATISWVFREVDTANIVTIVGGCILNPSFAGRYDVINIGFGQCDLVVLEASKYEAGMYGCAAFDPAPTAQLVVIDGEPSCTIDNTEPMAGDNVTMSCSVTYTSNLSPMMMTWSDPQGNPIEPSTLRRADHTVYSSIVITAAQPRIRHYTCKTNFTQPENLSASAANTPDYVHNWISPDVTVGGYLVPPENTVGVQGSSVTMKCRRLSQRVAWTFNVVGGTSSVVITQDCEVLPAVSQFYDTDTVNGSCHLIVKDLAKNLAGKYSCQNIESSEPVVSAELVALETEPMCASNITADFVEPFGSAEFTCTVGYSGNIHPAIVWRDNTGRIIPDQSTKNNTYFRSSIVVTPHTQLLESHTASITFSAPTYAPPPFQDPDTNRPRYNHTYASEPKPVLLGHDCTEILSFHPTAPTGLYNIAVKGSNSGVQVWCDMTGGGWTVFQRRMDGSENFYRNWADYVAGFGNAAREFWIGLDSLSAITGNKRYKLNVNLEDFSVNTRWAEYTNFVVGSASTKYELISIGAYTGTAGDSLFYHEGRKFTTLDEDNDEYDSGNCAVMHLGAWWYRSCHWSNLNGDYNNTMVTIDGRGIVWYTWLGDRYSLRQTEMKLQPF